VETFALILIFVCIACIVWLLGRAISKPKMDSEEVQFRTPNAFGGLTEPLAMALPIRKKKLDELGKELICAGHYNSNAKINFLAQRNVAMMLCMMAAGIVFVAEVFPGEEWVVGSVGLTLSVFCYSLPRILLSTRAKVRSKKIERALPDALDMISMSVEGGVPIQRAINLVADEFESTHRPLARELKIVSRQTETGSLPHALAQFSKRLDSPEVVGWAAMLEQSQRLGVGVVDSMREYADRIRELRKQKAEQVGQTATIKLLLPVVLCLGPPIFILLIGPAILDLRDFINRERGAATELVQQAKATSGFTETLASQSEGAIDVQ
jgi:tight adherence protein C